MGKGMYRIADEWAQIEKYSAMKKILQNFKIPRILLYSPQLFSFIIESNKRKKQ